MAKSKLILRVNDELDPFGNNVFSGDYVALSLNDGNPSTSNTSIHETPSINRTVKGLFIVKGGHSTSERAKNMASKFKNDWANTGGSGNVKVTYYSTLAPYSGSNFIEFELQKENWTFDSVYGQAVLNGKVSQVFLSNAAPPTPKTLTLTLGNTANCGLGTVEYTAEITGGTPPYTIKGTAFGNIPATSGTKVISLSRVQPTTVSVYDSTNTFIASQSLEPPILLNASHFKVTVGQDGTSPTAIISEAVVLPNTLFPITYSMDDSNYQASGNFTNLDFEETYTIYIKDKFGCKVQKTFVTPEESNLPTQTSERYFEISNAGTLIWSKCEELTHLVKKNFHNTSSIRDNVNVPYQYIHQFDYRDLIPIQFKSSYDWHKISILSDGAEYDINYVEQSQNLGLVEKVDAKLFRNVDGGLGIYFRNGNTYIEGTTTVNGSSPYDAINLPTWAKTGEQAYVDGIGTVTIKRILRDSQRGLYLQTGSSYSSLTDDDGKIQANYNKQPYNTYEFAFLMSSLGERSQVIIEGGFNGQTEAVFRSEIIEKITDDCQRYLLQWSDTLNVAGIVHQTDISHFARLYGSLTPTTSSESEVYNGDSDPISLDQKVFDSAEFKVAVVGFKMQKKLHQAFGMDSLFINNIHYVKESMETEAVEGTNYFIVTAKLRFGGNELEVNEQELVLKDPVIGTTAKPSLPETLPTAFAASSGGLVLNGSGGTILIDNG